MMRKRNKAQEYIYILLIFNTLCFYAQDSIVLENDSLILWQKDRKLEWGDFKGEKPDHKENVLAETHGKIVIVSHNTIDYVPIIQIGTYFKKHSSWTSVRDSSTLEHEQIHFDIYELFTRKIRKAFCKLNDEGNIDSDEYEQIFQFFLKKEDDYNESYEVDVLTNPSKQLEWQKKIAEELEELREYEFIPEQ